MNKRTWVVRKANLDEIFGEVLHVEWDALAEELRVTTTSDDPNHGWQPGTQPWREGGEIRTVCRPRP